MHVNCMQISRVFASPASSSISNSQMLNLKTHYLYSTSSCGSCKIWRDLNRNVYKQALKLDVFKLEVGITRSLDLYDLSACLTIMVKGYSLYHKIKTPPSIQWWVSSCSTFYFSSQTDILLQVENTNICLLGVRHCFQRTCIDDFMISDQKIALDEVVPI